MHGAMKKRTAHITTTHAHAQQPTPKYRLANVLEHDWRVAERLRSEHALSGSEDPYPDIARRFGGFPMRRFVQ